MDRILALEELTYELAIANQCTLSKPDASLAIARCRQLVPWSQLRDMLDCRAVWGDCTFEAELPGLHILGRQSGQRVTEDDREIVGGATRIFLGPIRGDRIARCVWCNILAGFAQTKVPAALYSETNMPSQSHINIGVGRDNRAFHSFLSLG